MKSDTNLIILKLNYLIINTNSTTLLDIFNNLQLNNNFVSIQFTDTVSNDVVYKINKFHWNKMNEENKILLLNNFSNQKNLKLQIKYNFGLYPKNYQNIKKGTIDIKSNEFQFIVNNLKTNTKDFILNKNFIKTKQNTYNKLDEIEYYVYKNNNIYKYIDITITKQNILFNLVNQIEDNFTLKNQTNFIKSIYKQKINNNVNLLQPYIDKNSKKVLLFDSYTQINLNDTKLNETYEGINPFQFKKYFAKYNDYLFLDQVYLVSDYVFYLNNDEEYSQGIITNYKIKNKEITYTIQDDNVKEKPIKIRNDNIITKLNGNNQNIIQSNIFLFNKKINY